MLYFVYIMASKSKTLYVGVTRDLRRRVVEHRERLRPHAFSSRYRTAKLVFFETTTDVMAAIAREKQIKGWRRERKIGLIEQTNPDWRDLAVDWFQDGRC